MKLPLSHALLIQCLNWNYHCFLFVEANHIGAIVNANILVTSKKNANLLVILEMTFSSTFVVKEQLRLLDVLVVLLISRSKVIALAMKAIRIC